MNWKLNQAKDVECTLDDSGIYTVINRNAKNQHSKGYLHTTAQIRVDVMLSDGDKPLQSFIGEGNAVRKTVIGWLWDYYLNTESIDHSIIADISTEHASYIGYEIACAMFNEHYIQS